MVDKLDAFIEESKKLIGKEVVESPPSYTFVHKRAVVFFSIALGWVNPLFVDPNYAVDSRYSCLLAPQTFLAAVRYPASEGALSKEDYGLAKFFTRAEFKWNDVIRWGDNFTTELKLANVLEEVVENKRVAKLVSEGHYWRRNNDLVGTCNGTVSMIPFNRGEEMLTDRDIHVYSDEEIPRIAKDIDGEVSRGDATLYWEEVNEGDTLTPVIKGPVSHPDLFVWRGMTAPVTYCLEPMYRRTLKEPGNRLVNPTTNWPYWHADLTQEDLFSCKLNGMPQPWMHGLHRVCLAEDLLAKWMGDDGFIRRLNIEILKPFLYMDANWYSGKIVDKYKERLDGVMYKAVDIRIDVTNQLGDKTASGDATVYLPSKGCEVKLPIPQ